jgi:two-component system chemotaxis sensor kinase CheA
MTVNCEIGPEEFKMFLEEAEEHLQLLDEDIVRLGTEGASRQLLQEIFRSAHTLKGSSAMLGHHRMAEVTHAMESLLDQLRNHKISANSGVIDALLFGLDALKALKNEVVSQKESDVNVSATVSRLNEVAKMQAGVGDACGTGPHIGIAKHGKTTLLGRDMDNKLTEASKEGLNIYVVKAYIDERGDWLPVRSFQLHNDLSTMGEIISSAPSLKDIEQGKVTHEFTAIISCKSGRNEILETLKLSSHNLKVTVFPYKSVEARQLLTCREEIVENEQQGQGKEPPENRLWTPAVNCNFKHEPLQSIRVDVTDLDNLMNMAENLVADRSRINQICMKLESKYPEDEIVIDLADACNHMIKVIDDLYQDIIKVRMVPISLVFNKLPRLVRDTARKLHKDLDFVIEGENTELDRTIVEQIRDPLVHLLRNAVDHGIESKVERRAKGKTEKALIMLSAYEENGHIVIKLEDDGRGIDHRRVRESAAREGFLSAEATAKLSDAEAIDLIFLPGISTVEKATDVSGRGVGLDIVKTNVERLNGSVTLRTCMDKGATFTIKLPPTVAVIHGGRLPVTYSALQKR